MKQAAHGVIRRRGRRPPSLPTHIDVPEALRAYGTPASIALVLALLSVVSAPDPIGLFGAALAVLVVMIADIDRRRFVIPDTLNAIGAVLGMAYVVVQSPEPTIATVVLAATRGAAAAAAFLALRYVYRQWRGRQGIGLGDVKLAAVGGIWLDWIMLSLAVQLATFAALAVYIVSRVMIGQSVTGTDRVPFGLFFAPAIWCIWLLQRLLAL